MMIFRLIILAVSLMALCCSSQMTRAKGGLEVVSGLDSGSIEDALRPRRLALLVGIDRFGDRHWPDLKHARNDAMSLAEVLQDPKQGGFDHVEVLASSEGTIKDDINSALERLQKQNASSQDTVLVYFSTHGTLARGPKGSIARYLVTSDTDQQAIAASGLPVFELQKRIESFPSSRKVLIMAACHSGSGKSFLPQAISNELLGIKSAFFVRPIEEISQASIVLTASAWGETAREDDSLGHDIYTYFLLEALSGKDADGDGAVSATEAHAHAMQKTYYYTKGRQRPQVESTILGADPIILSGRRTKVAEPVFFSFLPHFEGLRVSIDGREKGKLPNRLVLTPGSHRIVVFDDYGDEPIFEDTVDMVAGQRLSLENLLEKNKPNWHLYLRGGYQTYLDSATRKSLVAPTGLYGLSLSYIDLPIEKFELGLDFTIGGGTQSLEIGGFDVQQTLLEVAYGIQVLFYYPLEPFVFLVGPRLAGVHIIREGVANDGSNQQFFNFSPGLVGQLRWNFYQRLSLDLEVRTHFFLVKTKTENQNLGYLDIFGGLGWSF
jgi:hypothetical protein